MPTREEVLQESILIVIGKPGQPVFRAIHEDPEYLAKIGESMVAGSDHYTDYDIVQVNQLDVEEISYRAIAVAVDRHVDLLHEKQGIKKTS